MIPEPRHQSGCATCPEARCCVHFEPELTGSDVARLVAGFGGEVAAFARLKPARADQAGPEGILLGDDGLVFLLCLRSRADDGALPRARPCVLLTRTGGRDRCGAYAHRPMRCRTFPTEVAPWGVVVDNPDAICPPGAWSLERTDVPATRLLHRYAEGELTAWRTFLAAWNAEAARRPTGDRATAEARFFAAVAAAHRP